MDWLQYWYAFPIAIFASTMAMSGGVGGGLIFGPFFLSVLNLPPGQALGTALLTEAFGMSTGFYNYYRLRLIDYRTGLYLLLGSIPGAILGAVLINSKLISAFYINIMFGLTIATVGLSLAFRRKSAEMSTGDDIKGITRIVSDVKGNQYSYSITGIRGLILSSLLAGIGVGTVAIGSGEINTPRMINAGVPPKVAVPTSVFIMAGTVLSASSVYILNGQPLLPLAIYTCSGVIVGGTLGPLLISRISEVLLKRGLAVLFTVIGVCILVHAFY